MPAPALHPEVAVQPVHWLPDDDPEDQPEAQGLCLSGGGYRAMLFHVGSLWRLNEAALLTGLSRISSVSAGSIVAGVLALHWHELEFGEDDVAAGFVDCLVDPIRDLASRTIDEPAILSGGILPGRTVAQRLASAYRKHVFHDATLQDLPDVPRFVINATNLDSGELWRFTKTVMADWRVGAIPSPTLPLGEAVAASSAFPPVLSPLTLDLRGGDWQTQEGNDLTSPAYRDEPTLCDGGVYDNLGLETMWKRCRSVLISDAGGHLGAEPDPPHDWPHQTLRVLQVTDNQVRSLRKRQVIASLAHGQRTGAYWGIRSHTADYELDDPLPCPPEATGPLADLATRLKATDDAMQERLINWGYAICDTALRRWVDTELPRGTFPYDRGVQ